MAGDILALITKCGTPQSNHQRWSVKENQNQRKPLELPHLPLSVLLALSKQKPLHSTEGGKEFWVFDLWVVRLISVLSTLTSTGQFCFIHPLSSMILS